MTKILICDDEGIVRQSLQFMIEKAFGDECELEFARNGRTAIELAESFHPDIILMDIQMPVMDGYTATAALRSLRRADAKTAIILAMTANVFSDDVIKAEASGMNGHISKPFDPDKLSAMIAASCHKKRG